MSGRRGAAALVLRGAAWRRPTELVEQSRRLFLVCAYTALLVTGSAAVTNPHGGQPALGLASSATLAGIWALRYRRRRVRLALDLLEAVALCSLAAACPVPTMVFGTLFPAIWLRAVYGSNLSVARYGALTIGAVLLSLPFSRALHPDQLPDAVSAVVGVLPLLVLNVIVARHLARNLFARQQAADRDHVLARLGAGLLDEVDSERVLTLAWQALTEICASTPGLSLLLLQRGPDGLQVLRTAGTGPQPAPVLLSGDLAALPPGEVRPVPDSPLLGALGGSTRSWRYLAVPAQAELLLLVGESARAPDDGATAVLSVVNQGALAIRASRKHQQLTEQALTDSLTGLPNRSSFLQALDTRQAGFGAGASLLLLDLDDFKLVNDGLGHLAGDELLRQVARRLRDGVRPGDVCARLGGDEFAVVLGAEHDDDSALAVAERLVELVAAPLVLDGHRAVVGVSVGLARGEQGLPTDALVRRADIAMYAAKAQGKNRVQVFRESLLPEGAAAAPLQATPA